MVRVIGLSLFLVAVPVAVNAAVVPVRGESIELSASPDYPLPDSSATLTAHVSLESLSKLIVWTVDGEVLTEGIGITEVTVPTGGLGSETSVEAAIVENGSVRGSDRYVIRPGEVDLVWEGKTYVPPLYIGRPLANANADVVVAAYPRIVRNGALVERGNLRYSWSVDGVPVQSTSGYGRSSITVRPPRYTDAFTVAVTVESDDRLATARSSVTISPTSPFAVVYEDRPLTGIDFSRAIAGTATLQEDEISFRAFPFFAANPSELEYEWRFNNQPIPVDAAEPYSVTFRRTDAGGGTFPVAVTFESARLSFERAADYFNLSL